MNRYTTRQIIDALEGRTLYGADGETKIVLQGIDEASQTYPLVGIYLDAGGDWCDGSWTLDGKFAEGDADILDITLDHWMHSAGADKSEPDPEPAQPVTISIMAHFSELDAYRHSLDAALALLEREVIRIFKENGSMADIALLMNHRDNLNAIKTLLKE